MHNNPITSITIYRCNTETKIRIRRKNTLSRVYHMTPNRDKRANYLTLLDKICGFDSPIVTCGVGGLWVTYCKK